MKTAQEWVDYLKSRCESEGVKCWLSDSDLWGWVAGVNEADEEDNVFAALCETLDQPHK